MPIEGFDDALAALAAHEKLKGSQVKQLSGLGSAQLQRLKATWHSMPDPERMHLLATLRKTAEDDALVDFDSVYAMAMEDPNADIRRVAVVSVTESNSESIMERLLALCSQDPEELVRCAAAERLGPFAYEAEVGTLPEEDARRIEAILLERTRSETEAPQVRGSALASLGYFSTEAVRQEIQRALTRSGFLLSAIRAIGRSMDPVWTPVLIEQMGSSNAAVRREAAEAAADYEDSVSALSELVDDPDRSVRLASIASLGTIAGPEARDVLVYCFESADPEIREAASRALQAIEEPEAPLGSVDFGQYEGEES